MSLKAIDSRVYGANARSSPRFGNNVVAYLNQCDPVEVVGPKQGGRWIPCKVDGHTGTVFISENILRDRVSEAKERLVRECVKQWLRFDKEAGAEHISPYHKYVGEYWQSIGLDHLDGTDRDQPWANAFISFCVREAGGYDGFKYSAAASPYVHQAIRRKLDNEKGPFWGCTIDGHKVEVGDIVCRNMGLGGITYEYASTHSSFRSHCDIVISIRDDHVSTLGGNVGNTVKRVNYSVSKDGFLADTVRSICVMRNML